MKQAFLYLIIMTFMNHVSAQTRDTSWNKMKDIETAFYSLKVPSGWMDLGHLGSLVDQSFDATGLYFADSYNNAPVIAGLFVMNAPADNLEDAKAKCLNGYRENPDRIFPAGFMEGQQKITLQSGQAAYILNTRFYRPTKQLNQSRFDMVVFSDQAKQAYLVTVSVQYKDDTYQFENINRLESFANKLFGFFYLK